VDEAERIDAAERGGNPMRRLLRYGLIVVVAAVAVAAALYFLFPETLFKLATEAQRRSAGLVKKEVQVDDHRIPYLEGGTGQTVVLLHGFGDTKDGWTAFARYIRGYQLVIPDVPGFGESSRVAADDYGIESQVARIHRFVEVLRLDRFHLAGASLGGALAASYAARHPEKVLTLMLEDTAGAPSPTKSPLVVQLETGNNPLLPRNAEEFDKLMALVFEHPPAILPAFTKIVVADWVAHRGFNEKIWRDSLAGPISLAPVLPLIQAPVLIVWGDRDRLCDIGGVAFLEQNLKHDPTVILRGTGHSPEKERPEDAASAYVRFLGRRR
jgi:pimeloyl-ACP methyl ester carboxylesterase